MKDEVFCSEITAELLSLFTCEKCGQTGQVCWFREPSVHRKSDDRVEVVFPLSCWCQQGAFFRIEMNLVQFGHLLTESVFRRPFSIGEMKQLESRPARVLLESGAALAGMVERYAATKAESNGLPLRASTVALPKINKRARHAGLDTQSN